MRDINNVAFIYNLVSAEEERKKKSLIIHRRRLRDRSDPLELPEKEFIKNFRLN